MKWQFQWLSGWVLMVLDSSFSPIPKFSSQADWSNLEAYAAQLGWYQLFSKKKGPGLLGIGIVTTIQRALWFESAFGWGDNIFKSLVWRLFWASQWLTEHQSIQWELWEIEAWPDYLTWSGRNRARVEQAQVQLWKGEPMLHIHNKLTLAPNHAMTWDQLPSNIL